jgi:hypothetical protein
MASTLAVLESRQQLHVAQAVKDGKTITYNVQPCPSSGFVWPYIAANGVPLVPWDPRQTQLMLQAIKNGKTLGTSVHPATGQAIRRECPSKRLLWAWGRRCLG